VTRVSPLVQRRTALAVAALVVAFAPRPSIGARGPLARGLPEVNEAQQTLKQQWKAVQIKRIKALGGKSAAVLEIKGEQDDRFIVRRPRRGIEHGLRVSIAQHRLAAQLDAVEMIPAAIVAKTAAQLDANTPAGADVMVVAHAGKQYVGGDTAAPAVIAHIPERQRVVAAIIDLLAEQQDRKSANILVERTGKSMMLIDPDKTFGQRHGAKYRSQVFHGGKMGFSSAQARFEDLDPDLQGVVDAIARAPLPELESIYGLQQAEAKVMSDRAKRIRQVGLRAAIDEYVTSLGALHAPE